MTDTDHINLGIDVSSEKLNLAFAGDNREREFANTEDGIAELTGFLDALEGDARVVVEATSTYHRSVAEALAAHSGSEVMVANPNPVKHYMGFSKQRTKTDELDARTIAEFGADAEFEVWQPPSEQAGELRRISRRLGQLVDKRTLDKNQNHAADADSSTPAPVAENFADLQEELNRQIDRLHEAAKEVIASCPELSEKFELLQTVTGIGERSAIYLLGELAVLPEDMLVKHWVAHAGLDPVVEHSGKDNYGPGRISKQGNARLRHRLYMPAMCALANKEGPIWQFRQVLVKERGKKPIQALVAVMRKLLHCIYGIFKHREPFDEDKFYNPPNSSKSG